MRKPSQITYVLNGSAAFAILAGCSGGGSPSASLTPIGRARDIVRSQDAAVGSRHAIMTKSFLRPDAVGKPLIFVSGIYQNFVYVYLQAGKNQQPVGQIATPATLYTQNLGTDASGNLYVPISFPPPTEASDVLVYAPPYSKAPRELPDPGGYAADVAISPQGVVAVANACNASCAAGSGSVTFYAKNATRPCATVSDAPYNVDSDAFDGSGNLYVRADEFPPSRQATIGEITGGCNATTVTELTTANSIETPETNGIKVDKAGRIAVLTTAGPYYDNIDTYDPPISGSLGSPVSVTPVTTPAYPHHFAFLASGKYFYTAETQFGGLANEYRYSVGPASGKAINSITVGGGPYGVAVTPPLIP
jgi:hypothetical protein